MPGLDDSRWAPAQTKTFSQRTPPPVKVDSTQPTAVSEANSLARRHEKRNRPVSAVGSHNLARYAKIVRRMKWKGQFLDAGYRLAVARDPAMGGDPARAAEAELMFKLDFHEYYMLVERALVHLLGVFGIVVSRDFRAGTNNTGAGKMVKSLGASMNKLDLSMHNSLTRSRSLRNELEKSMDFGGDCGESSKGSTEPQRPKWNHAYHANVLHSLDRPENPLHEALGTGDVRRQLWRAKELRNRWKTADEEDGGFAEAVGIVDDQDGQSSKKRFVAAPLETYDLSKILTTIFAGLDQAYIVAREHVYGTASLDRDVEMRELEHELEEGENEWEFMLDAMDWEAV